MGSINFKIKKNISKKTTTHYIHVFSFITDYYRVTHLPAEVGVQILFSKTEKLCLKLSKNSLSSIRGRQRVK